MGSRVDILVFTTGEAAALCRALEERGLTADVVTTVRRAQEIFLDRGGHALLVLTEEVGTGLAQRVVDTLRGVDEHLPVVVFGDDALRGVSRTNLHRVRGLHPASRAGVGAIQKVLCRPVG